MSPFFYIPWKRQKISGLKQGVVCRQTTENQVCKLLHLQEDQWRKVLSLSFNEICVI